MRVTKIIFFIGLAAIIAAALMLAWLYLPSLRQRSLHTFIPEAAVLDTRGSLHESWSSELDAPRWVHLGESGTLQLTVTPEIASPQPDPGSDRFANSNVVVEARAEIPAAGASPSGLSSQTLAPGHPARFEWRITPQSEGLLEGRVWLYLRFIPKNGSESTRRPLSVLPLTINSDTLFGRVTDQVRQIALIGLGIGLVLALPYLLMWSHARRVPSSAPSPEEEF